METSQLIAAVLTVAGFVAAFFAARSAKRNGSSSVLELDGDLLAADLLEAPAVATTEPPVVSSFERIFLVVLLLYALLDRGFAWFHLPGTPLFVGEITLLFGVVAMMATRTNLLTALRRSTPLKTLALWMAWGMALLAIQLPVYGLDAVRDSAIWYYGLVGVLVVFLLISDPTRFGRWADSFTAAIPIILVWTPIAMVLAVLFGGGAPFVPDSQTPLFFHRFGNMGVMAGSILAFIWLVDRERGRFTPNQRIGWSALAVVAILAVGFQNRGGMVAAVIGMALVVVFMRSRRGEMVLAVGAVVIGLASLAILTDVTIPLEGGREISTAQMMDNIGSIIDPSSGDERQTGTTQWRLELWTKVLDDVVTEHPVDGFGPGPDLGARYGVTTNEDTPLRNPHNSHLSVVARMGFVGFGLWVLLWLGWGFQLMVLRGRLLAAGRTAEAGVTAWLVISSVTVLVNAVFDPTLEGPQVAFWLWTFFGVGVAMPLVYSGISGRAWAHTTGGDLDATIGTRV